MDEAALLRYEQSLENLKRARQELDEANANYELARQSMESAMVDAGIHKSKSDSISLSLKKKSGRWRIQLSDREFAEKHPDCCVPSLEKARAKAKKDPSLAEVLIYQEPEPGLVLTVTFAKKKEGDHVIENS